MNTKNAADSISKNLHNIYDAAFYAEQGDTSFASAKILVPLIQALFNARSVQDFGCGTDGWLAVFRDHGAQEVLGYDSNMIQKELLRLPLSCIRQNCDFSSPAFTPEKQSDLAISLEVAEHLPASSASVFIAALVKAAPCVCFSAALPHQGGVQHLNERPLSYWRRLFAEHGFFAFDPFRQQIFYNEGISWWYRQNIVCFVNVAWLKNRHELADKLSRHIINEKHSMTVIGNYLLERLCCSHIAFNELFMQITTQKNLSQEEVLSLCSKAFFKAKLGDP